MDIGFLHLHSSVVTVFLLLLVFKTVLLTLGKKILLAKIRSKTKIADMILGTLIIVSGAYILFLYGTISSFYVVKFLLMLVAIPLGIIGLKREKVPFAWASVLIFVYIYGVSETKSLTFKPSHKFELSHIEVEVANEEDDSVQSDAVAAIMETQQATLVHNGKVIYQALCVQCHGDDGGKGLFKAPKLSESRLAMDARMDIIKNGKGNMPHNKGLNEKELAAVATYIETFR